MKKNVKVTPDQVADVIMKALAEYGDKVYDTTDAIAKKEARETASDLKANSPVNTGQYARGWSRRQTRTAGHGTEQTVYNRQYQLVHLLEKPHDTWNGGHYPSKKDHTGMVARIEKTHVNDFFMEVLRKL